MKKKTRIYACDFETTVYDGQTTTEVWSSAICPVRSKAQQESKNPKPAPYDDEVIVHHSINETYDWLVDNGEDCILYYHNLKFDGGFWLDFLMRNGWSWYHREKKADKAPVKSFETCISDLGQWYYMRLNFEGFTAEIRDSLKLLPVDLRSLGKSFHVKHQKLEMEYVGRRYAGCPISSEEMHYIRNDVLCLAECLEIMFKEDHNKLTIGSCCIADYKKMLGKTAWNEMFPDLTRWDAPTGENADTYIRRSYKGGWCYAMPSKCGKIWNGGCTADVNSLYPSMMSAESGNYYPVGVPHWFTGVIPKKIEQDYNRHKYFYFIRLRCAFRIKENHLPFIQIKGNMLYKGTEMLTDSRPTISGVKYREYNEPITGEKITDVVELTLTCTDWELMKEHYNIYDLEILDGCWFYTDIGIFERYVSKWRRIKENSKGAQRFISKRFLNSLYGKFATSPENWYKKPVMDSEGNIKLQTNEEDHSKKVVYIAVGSAITSYARRFTITAAQKNFQYFCYADTDSIHCACRPGDLEGVPVHPTAFCHWKIESCWDEGYFVRQKTYIEHIYSEDLQEVKHPYYNVKCAGMPDRCKDVFIQSMEETEMERQHNEKMYKVYKELKRKGINTISDGDGWKYKFLSKKRTVKDFKPGLSIYGKLIPVRIKGGILLKESFFTMR